MHYAGYKHLWYPRRKPPQRVVEQLHDFHLVAGIRQVIGELATDQPGTQHDYPAATGDGVAKTCVIVEIVYRHGSIDVATSQEIRVQ